MGELMWFLRRQVRDIHNEKNMDLFVNDLWEKGKRRLSEENDRLRVDIIDNE